MELPGMDGSEFCGRIRGGEDTIDVPFVIYTSEARQQQHLRALKAGADDYIPKESEAEEVSLRIHRLIERVESLRRLSIIDSLTMLANRRYFDRRLVEECEKFRRYNRPLSLLLFDVDEFKFINDTYGHIAGDKALKSIADVLLNGLRTGDVVCRYGGDEFAVLMPETSLEGAWHASERLRLNVERLRIHAAPQDNTVRAAANIKLSISGGVSTFIDESQRDSKVLRTLRKKFALYRTCQKVFGAFGQTTPRALRHYRLLPCGSSAGGLPLHNCASFWLRPLRVRIIFASLR